MCAQIAQYLPMLPTRMSFLRPAVALVACEPESDSGLFLSYDFVDLSQQMPQEWLTELIRTLEKSSFSLDPKRVLQQAVA